MDRKRNIGNRNNPGRIGRRNRNRTLRRRPLRLVRPNRNRLSRVQNNINRNRLGLGFNRRRKFNNFRRRINNNFRIIFVGNLPYNISTRDLRKLFRPEGFINTARVVTGPLGSKGYGFIEFRNPRDAWKSIQKWNKTFLGGRRITVQYRRRRRNNFKSFNNYQRNNQFRGNRGGFRPRGRRY